MTYECVYDIILDDEKKVILISTEHVCSETRVIRRS